MHTPTITSFATLALARASAAAATDGVARLTAAGSAR